MYIWIYFGKKNKNKYKISVSGFQYHHDNMKLSISTELLQNVSYKGDMINI